MERKERKNENIYSVTKCVSVLFIIIIFFFFTAFRYFLSPAAGLVS